MVRIHPDPPSFRDGAIAQLGERLLCKQEVTGSIPVGSTSKCRQEAIGKRQEREQQSAKALIGVSSASKHFRLLFKNLGRR